MEKQPALYTDEQLQTLSGNAFVSQALPTRIVFTDRFKDLLEDAINKGRRPEEVFTECGIDPAILGPKRVARLVAAVTRRSLHIIDDTAYFTMRALERARSTISSFTFRESLNEGVEAGRRPEEILAECGIEPAILEPKDIAGLVAEVLRDHYAFGKAAYYVILHHKELDERLARLTDPYLTNEEAFAELEETHQFLVEEAGWFEEEMDFLQRLAGLEEQAAKWYRRRHRKRRG